MTRRDAVEWPCGRLEQLQLHLVTIISALPIMAAKSHRGIKRIDTTYPGERLLRWRGLEGSFGDALDRRLQSRSNARREGSRSLRRPHDPIQKLKIGYVIKSDRYQRGLARGKNNALAGQDLPAAVLVLDFLYSAEVRHILAEHDFNHAGLPLENGDALKGAPYAPAGDDLASRICLPGLRPLNRIR